MPPWSYSALSDFESCPKKYWELRVKKRYPREDTEATIWGKEVHTAMEYRVKEGRALPSWGTKWENIAEKLVSQKHKGAQVLTEEQLAISHDFQPTTWESSTAWARCILDVVVIDGPVCTSIDWKTGKIKPSKQLEMSAGIIFCHNPKVEVVKTAFFWLKHNEVTRAEYQRKDIPKIWNEFLPRVKRLELAYENDKWLEKPSGLCSGYCPVKTCKFWKEKR